MSKQPLLKENNLGKVNSVFFFYVCFLLMQNNLRAHAKGNDSEDNSFIVLSGNIHLECGLAE